VKLDAEDKNSQTWTDHNSISEAMCSVCQIFEEKLSKENPEKRKLTYGIEELFLFIETIPDLACMTYDNSTNKYVPHDRAWVKKHVFVYLRSQVMDE